MLTKLIFLGCTTGTFAAAIIYLAEMDAPTISLVITGLTGLITAIFGGMVLYGQAKSKARIEEMKAAADIDRIRNEAHKEVERVRAEAQKAVSLVNTSALAGLQTAMTANTLETMKSVATADQVKVRVEQLDQKIPVRQSDTTLIPEGDVEGHKK